MIRQQGRVDLARMHSHALYRGLVTLSQLDAHSQSCADDGEVGTVEQVVEMRATGIDATIAAVIQQHLCEPENGHNQIDVAVLPITQLRQLRRLLRLIISLSCW